MLKWFAYLLWGTSFLALGCYGLILPRGTPWSCKIGQFHPLGTCTSPYGQERSPDERLYWPLQFGFETKSTQRYYNLDWSVKDIVGGSHYRQLIFYWSLRTPGRDYGNRARALFCRSETIREKFSLDPSAFEIVFRLVSPDPQYTFDRKVRYQCP